MHTDAAQLSRLLDSLLPENESQIMPASTIRFAARSSAKSSRFVIASIAGIAACALFAFVMFRPKTAPPVANNSTSSYSATSQLTQQVASVIPSSIENAKPPVAKASPHTQRVVHKSSIHSLGDSDLKFIPLDDDGPIESGMIVRMDLNATPSASHSARGGKKVPVDVLLDQQGEVRAIR